jgi:hypothetical protein
MVHSSTKKTKIYRGLGVPYFMMRLGFSKDAAVRHPAALHSALARIRGIGLDALVHHVPPARFPGAPAVGLLHARATPIASAAADRPGAALKYTRRFSRLSLHLALHLLGTARRGGLRPRLGRMRAVPLVLWRLGALVHRAALLARAWQRCRLPPPVVLALALGRFRLEWRRFLLWRLRVERGAAEAEHQRGQSEPHVRSAPACGSAARSSGCRRR